MTVQTLNWGGKDEKWHEERTNRFEGGNSYVNVSIFLLEQELNMK